MKCSTWLSISFDDSIAYYSTTITYDYANDEIEAKLLLHNGVVLTRHTISDSGHVSFQFVDSAEIEKTYTLTVDYSVNEAKYPTISSARAYEAE